MDNLSEHPEAANQCPGLNWDNLIPPDSDDAFYSSMNIQILFFIKNVPRLNRIRDICAIFEIGHDTYYQMLPTGQDPEAMISLSEQCGNSETREGKRMDDRTIGF
jgi:hypothetical protein